MLNKLHFAACGHTTAEVAHERAYAEKTFIGLTNFWVDISIMKDIGIAKNYLSENDLKVFNNFVFNCFVIVEI